MFVYVHMGENVYVFISWNHPLHYDEFRRLALPLFSLPGQNWLHPHTLKYIMVCVHCVSLETNSHISSWAFAEYQTLRKVQEHNQGLEQTWFHLRDFYVIHDYATSLSCLPHTRGWGSLSPGCSGIPSQPCKKRWMVEPEHCRCVSAHDQLITTSHSIWHFKSVIHRFLVFQSLEGKDRDSTQKT